VAPEESGKRVDAVVSGRLPQLGRKRIADLCKTGALQVDGRRVRKSQIVEAEQLITLQVPEPARAEPEPDAQLELVLIRPDLVVTNKPAGMPSGAVPGKTHGTLAGALLARFPEIANVGFGPLEPGLVHRLDTFTSGLLVAARTQAAFMILRRLLGQGQLIKRYLAIVENAGLPEAGIVDANLEPHPHNRRKVLASRPTSGHGRPARLEFRVCEQRGGLSLLELSTGPAYRHQVRALLAFAGWPILGDTLYGASASQDLPPNRHALHACYVRAETSPDMPGFTVECELPEDLSRLFRAG